MYAAGSFAGSDRPHLSLISGEAVIRRTLVTLMEATHNRLLWQRTDNQSHWWYFDDVMVIGDACPTETRTCNGAEDFSGTLRYVAVIILDF